MFLQVVWMHYYLIFVSFLCILSLKYVLQTEYELRRLRGERGERAANGFLSGDIMRLPRGSFKGSTGCYDL